MREEIAPARAVLAVRLWSLMKLTSVKIPCVQMRKHDIASLPHHLGTLTSDLSGIKHWHWQRHDASFVRGDAYTTTGTDALRQS
jgi:hypothetical protein